MVTNLIDGFRFSSCFSPVLMKVGKRFILFLAVLPAFFSCITDSTHDNDSVGSLTDLNNYFLHINLGRAAFSSRAAVEDPGLDVENSINNLLLLFFKSAGNGPIIDRSFFIDDPVFSEITIEYPSRYLELPSYVIAFANIDAASADKIVENAEESVFSVFEIEKGIPMSSVRYFTQKGKPVFYTELNPKNFTESLPVDLFIERAVAKFTFEKGINLKIEPVVLKSGENELSFIFEPESWGVTATDLWSYYLKNLGTFDYAALNSILGSDETDWKWNHSLSEAISGSIAESHNFPTLHWAVSPCYFMDTFPDADDMEQTSLNFVRFEDMVMLKSETEDPVPLYVNETTRPSESFSLKNGLPCLVLGGHYLISGHDSPLTFYREGNMVWFEEEYRKLMAGIQKSLFIMQDDNLAVVSKDLFEILTVIRRPSDEILQSYHLYPQSSTISPGFVCPQLVEDISILENISASYKFFDEAGSPLDLMSETDRKKINKALINSCRLMEKYYQGNAVFVMPVAHLRPGTDLTGCYGIVRNHHYAVTLSSISGIGRGIPYEELRIGDMGVAPDCPPYEIVFSFKSNPWIDGGNFDVSVTE